MHKTMVATSLSFLMAVGGGAALAETGGQSPSPSADQPSQTSGQAGSPNNTARGPVGFAAEEIQTAPWTVERIDKQNRNMVLQAPDGTQNTVNVPAGTPGFDSLKKGDQIQLDYFEAAVVGAPGHQANAKGRTGATGSTGANNESAGNNSNRQIRGIRKVGNSKNVTPSHGNQPSSNSGGTDMTHAPR